MSTFDSFEINFSSESVLVRVFTKNSKCFKSNGEIVVMKCFC